MDQPSFSSSRCLPTQVGPQDGDPLSDLSYSELGFAASPKQILAAMLFLHVLAAASIMQKINYSGFLAHNDAGN